MKSVTIDSVVESRLKSHFGDDIPALDSIVVFEATVLSTRPLRKDGTIWENATITRSTLGEMASYLNAGELVPIHTLHMQGYEMPVGRLFYAEVFDLDDGHAELRAMFHLPKTEDKLITGIETGVIQALSVGISTKSILCSECGFDYLSEDADYINLIERVCPDGHEIGQGGAHAIGAGLKLWRETSLVSIGASKDAEIHSRSKQRLTPAQQYRLAASEGNKDITLVTTIQSPEESEMNAAEFAAQLTASAEAKAKAELAQATAETNLAAATEQVTALNARVSELETQLAAADNAEQMATLTAERDGAQADVSASLTFLQDQAVKALVASGHKDPVAPQTIAECIAAIEASSTNLVNLMANAGKSVAADAIVEGPARSTSLDAFRVNR